MRVAIVCEGSPSGEDQQVLEHLARRILPQAEVKAFPQGRKPDLIANAGAVVSGLVMDGYERVLIVWDVLPRFGRPDGEATDAAEINIVLTAAGVLPNPCVYLVAIHKELEAWLLADGAALSAALSRPVRAVNVANTANADQNGNPKKQLNKVFQQYARRDYAAKTDALNIAQGLANRFGVLGGIAAFKKFGRALTMPC